MESTGLTVALYVLTACCWALLFLPLEEELIGSLCYGKLEEGWEVGRMWVWGTRGLMPSPRPSLQLWGECASFRLGLRLNPISPLEEGGWSRRLFFYCLAWWRLFGTGSDKSRCHMGLREWGSSGNYCTWEDPSPGWLGVPRPLFCSA